MGPKSALMSRSPLPQLTPFAPLRIPLGFVVVGLFAALSLLPVSALADPGNQLSVKKKKAPIVDWRAQGLTYIELPLEIRANFDVTYMRHSFDSDHFASPYVNRVGPRIVSDESLESRISFTRPIADGVEIEIAWETRNRIAASDQMGFGRQIVGALIRFTP